MVVALICGGGNGAHVAAGIAASRDGVESRVLTLYGNEAERWRNAMNTASGLTLSFHDRDPVTLTSRPALVTNDPAEAMPGVDIIVFMVPAFAHEQYLHALKPHITPGLVLAGCPGQAGFEFAVMSVWGELAREVSYMNMESLPWACRITEYGRSVEVLGTKDTLSGAISLCTLHRAPGAPGTSPGTAPANDPYTAGKPDPVTMLQTVIGDLPKLSTRGHLLGITLMDVNGYVHPSVMYGEWSGWDGAPVPTPPLFYQGLSRLSAGLIDSISSEVVSLATVVMERYPGVDLSNVVQFHTWYVSLYSRDIADKTDTYSCFHSNAAYEGLTHPCVKDADPSISDSDGFLPDFNHRYLTEDIPFGLAVIKGVAEIVGVATPTIDKVVTWCQEKMGKEYIKDGKLSGKDVMETRAPQKYNLATVESLLGI